MRKSQRSPPPVHLPVTILGEQGKFNGKNEVHVIAIRRHRDRSTIQEVTEF